FAQCAETSEADFKAFCGRLVPLPEQYGDVRDSIAYLLWQNRRLLPDGGAAIVGNRALSPDTDARLQAIASLAFTDPDEAVGLILALAPAEPPIQAIAVLRLLDGGLLARASRETVYRLFNALNASARRWLEGRSTADGRRIFYAYRYETGIERPGTFGADDGPISSPDLYAYFALTCEALSRLADLVLDGGEVNKWRERSQSYLALLTSELWDGEKFVGINAYTGEKTGGDPLLSFMPLVLGGRLPAGIVDKLAADIDGKALRSAMGTLAIIGLYDAGRGELAARLAAEALEDARANGVECPFYGAALLELAAKVL
ncbi:MAG: hypothetical protein LBJ99_02635, partial [Oscillospiraceae bacterium]|nr:hypothetical protein [Oscillospiraceae bacterium]